MRRVPLLTYATALPDHVAAHPARFVTCKGSTLAETKDSLGRRLVDPVKDFLHDEVASGVVLTVGALAAVIWANGPSSGSYGSFWHSELTLGWGRAAITEDFQHWINDGLMAVFEHRLHPFSDVPGGSVLVIRLAAGEILVRGAAASPALGSPLVVGPTVNAASLPR